MTLNKQALVADMAVRFMANGSRIFGGRRVAGGA